MSDRRKAKQVLHWALVVLFASFVRALFGGDLLAAAAMLLGAAAVGLRLRALGQLP